MAGHSRSADDNPAAQRVEFGAGRIRHQMAPVSRMEVRIGSTDRSSELLLPHQLTGVRVVDAAAVDLESGGFPRREPVSLDGDLVMKYLAVGLQGPDLAASHRP